MDKEHLLHTRMVHQVKREITILKQVRWEENGGGGGPAACQ